MSNLSIRQRWYPIHLNVHHASAIHLNDTIVENEKTIYQSIGLHSEFVINKQQLITYASQGDNKPNAAFLAQIIAICKNQNGLGKKIGKITNSKFTSAL